MHLRRHLLPLALVAAVLAALVGGSPGPSSAAPAETGSGTADRAAATTSTVYGANFGASPDQRLYQGRPDAARLYYQSRIPSDLPSTSAFRRAYQAGVRVFVLSWKDPSSARVATALASLPDDVTVYGTYFHEPEDDIAKGRLTLAQWTSRTNAQAAIMRREGVVPTSILMAFTVVGGKNRRVSDYYNADVDVFGFDYYPDKLGQTPAVVVDKMAAAARAAGTGRLLIGEFGILNGAANGSALVQQTKDALSRAGAEVACYWSQDLHVLTPRVADAWFS